jgi:hypothetical protein
LTFVTPGGDAIDADRKPISSAHISGGPIRECKKKKHKRAALVAKKKCKKKR